MFNLYVIAGYRLVIMFTEKGRNHLRLLGNVTVKEIFDRLSIGPPTRFHEDSGVWVGTPGQWDDDEAEIEKEIKNIITCAECECDG